MFSSWLGLFFLAVAFSVSLQHRAFHDIHHQQADEKKNKDRIQKLVLANERSAHA